MIIPLLLAACTSGLPDVPGTQRGDLLVEAGAPPAPAPAPDTNTGWQPPDDDAQRAAIGTVPSEQAHLYDPSAFPSLAPPVPGDWLAEHHEAGQTYDQWRAAPGRLPTPDRRAIVLQALGEPEVSLSEVARVAEAWFGLPTGLAPSLTIEQTGAAVRLNPNQGQPQVLSTDLLDFLGTRLDAETFALVGVVQADLYPDPAWNFVFGQATYTEGVGVWSTARFRPGAPGGGPARAEDRVLVLRRTVKVMTHELGHMFGMKHCTFFACTMNGSNSLAETDRQPSWLCPVCLHKLVEATGMDPVQRYQTLLQAYQDARLDDEAAWVRRRLDAAAGAAGEAPEDVSP